MKALLLIIFTLFLFACQQPEDISAEEESSQDETTETIEVADNDTVDEESGGTEVVAKPNTTPPKFESNQSGVFADNYQIALHCSGVEDFKLTEIKLSGSSHNDEKRNLAVSSSSHPELFDGATMALNDYGRCDVLIVDVQFSESVNIEELSFYFNSTSPAVTSIKLSHLYSGGLKGRVYTASNLQDDRANFFRADTSTDFDTRNSNCPEGLEQNYDGSCYTPRILCSDFNSDYEAGKLPCGIKRDSEEVYCKPVAESSECSSLQGSICETASAYLTHSSQLFSLHFNESQIASTVCRKQKK